LSPGAFAAFLQAKGRRGEGTSYYRKLEATKKAKMGSKMYERKKMLKILKKHLTKLIMGVKGAGAAPDWQLAQMRVMMGRCPFRKDCRQDKAIDMGRVEYGALGYAGAKAKKLNSAGQLKKRVLVPIRTGVRRKQNSKAATAIQAAVRRMPARDMRYRTALAPFLVAKKAKAAVAAPLPPVVAPPPLLGPYPSLRAALSALSVPRGTALTTSKLGDRNIRYGKAKKKLKVGNKNKA
jgi:hypothetical protein